MFAKRTGNTLIINLPDGCQQNSAYPAPIPSYAEGGGHKAKSEGNERMWVENKPNVAYHKHFQRKKKLTKRKRKKIGQFSLGFASTYKSPLAHPTADR